jgi:hypothetical protein
MVTTTRIDCPPPFEAAFLKLLGGDPATSMPKPKPGQTELF